MKVPTNKNKKKPMQRELTLLGGASVSMLTVVIVLMFTASSAVPRYAMSNKQVAAVVSSVLVDVTNQDRASHDLGALTINSALVAAAQAKANDMAAKGYFAHVAPDGIDPWYWFAQAGYSFDYAGENLAIDFSDSVDVEKAWMNSPAHRENILNGRFTEIGIATAQGMYQGRMTTFVVQEFGTRKGTYSTVASADVVPANPTQIAVASAPHTIPLAATIESAHVRGTSAPEAVSLASPRFAENVRHEKLEVSAPAEAINPAPISEKPPLWAYMIGVPHAALTYSYYLLSFLVLVALAYTTRFELRKHHIRHATGAGFLVGLMGILLIVAHFTIFAEPVLAMAVR